MGAIRNLWLRWKMLRLPWRKKFFVGQDLAGNTFWEFHDALSANPDRMRRIVQKSPYSPKTHYADVQISPQWHQWLRQTRIDAPSIQEQTADLQRQAQLKHNARLADERWNSKARYIEKPKAQPRQITGSDVRVTAGKDKVDSNVPDRGQNASSSSSTMNHVQNPAPVPEPTEQASQTSSNPGATFSPESWAPAPSSRR